MKRWSLPEFFQKNMSHEQLLFIWSTFRDSSMGTKLKYLKFIKLWSPLEFFHKKMFHEHLPFMRSNYVILAWVQSWNIFEKLIKMCSPPEFFHKNMSHEQLLFTWSKFCDSSMGTKLK